MLSKIRARLTYANVMSSMAIFGVLATGTAYAANTVFSEDIVDGEVRTVDIARQAVVNNRLAANAVDSAKIADNTIQRSDIAAEGVASEEISNNGIFTADIANGAVVGADIRDDSVGTQDLKNNDVGGYDLATIVEREETITFEATGEFKSVRVECKAGEGEVLLSGGWDWGVASATPGAWSALSSRGGPTSTSYWTHRRSSRPRLTA
jgi:hypothetical protein